MKKLCAGILIAGILGGIQWCLATVLSDFSYHIQILNLVGINALMAVSLNLINGVTGRFSLGHAGFMAIGAYVAAACTFYGDPIVVRVFGGLAPAPVLETLTFVAALACGGGAAAAAGFLVGLPSLRLRGDYLAMATLGFGEIIRVVILNCEAVGGARGFPGIAERANFFWIFGALVLATWVLLQLVRSPKGLGFLAIREDEIAAASIGIALTRYKVTAFVIGAFIAGVGGGLFAHLMAYLHTNSFGFLKSFEYVAMVVLGGLGSFTGAILAAGILTVLPELARDLVIPLPGRSIPLAEARMVIYALCLIALMLWRREGLMGRKEFSWKRRRP